MDDLIKDLPGLLTVIVLFCIVIGFAGIVGVTIWGLVKGLHDRNIPAVITLMIVLGVFQIGGSGIKDRFLQDSTQVEINVAEKEAYIYKWVFPDERIGIELVEKRTPENSTRFHVITEADNQVYVVDVYEDKAFGLNRYEVVPFHTDSRLTPAHTKTPPR